MVEVAEVEVAVVVDGDDVVDDEHDGYFGGDGLLMLMLMLGGGTNADALCIDIDIDSEMAMNAKLDRIVIVGIVICNYIYVQPFVFCRPLLIPANKLWPSIGDGDGFDLGMVMGDGFGMD